MSCEVEDNDDSDDRDHYVDDDDDDDGHIRISQSRLARSDMECKKGAACRLIYLCSFFVVFCA